MTQLGGLLVSFVGACDGTMGRLWSHIWEGRGMRKAINRTLGPVCFGILWTHPCAWPQQRLPLALNQQQEPGEQSLDSWCR